MAATRRWRDLLPSVVWDRFEALKASDPAVGVAALMMGERAFEWFASIAPFYDEAAARELPPLPPDDLRRVVSDHQPGMFLWTGVVDAEMFLSSVARHVREPTADAPLRLVDFGGGCGRVARHLMFHPNARVVLTDSNPRHVQWCAENLKGVRCLVNGERPPFGVDLGAVDGLLAVSVFTHLPSDAFDLWLGELARSVAGDARDGGGVLVVTTHGPTAVNAVAKNATLQEYFRMTSEDAARTLKSMESDGFVYRRYDADQIEAASAGEDYGSTFVSRAEVERRAARAGLEVVEHVEAGLRGWQDVVVLRAKRG